MTIAFWLWMLITGPLIALGQVVLLPFCLANAWRPGGISIKDGRAIDRWAFEPLNWIWGNPEDGVSGLQAIEVTAAYTGPYWPACSHKWLRAYAWTACRNSCDNLKYLFARPGTGPSFKWSWASGGWGIQSAGPYNGGKGWNVPGLHIGKPS